MRPRTGLCVLLAAALAVLPTSMAIAGTGGEEQGTPGPDGESGDDGDESSSNDDDA